MRLEELTPGARVRGLSGPDTVEVVSARWIGSQAIEVVYRGNGALHEKLVYRTDEPALESVAAGPAFAFAADGAAFRLAAEALRIRLAHLFDPYVAVHASLIEPLPHQLTAVYGELLPRQPLRFLLADDPGAGKTIMAALFVKELLI